MPSDARRPALAGVAVGAMWASAFPAIEEATPYLGAIGLSVIRLASAAAILTGLAAVGKVRMPRRQDIGWIAACGFFGMTAYQWLLNEGELRVAAGTASLIVAAAPMVSVIVARVLFKDPISPYTLLGGAVALVGVALVCVAHSGISVGRSVGLVITAMVVQGVYHPLQRPLLRRYSSLEVATYGMLAGTLMVLPSLPWGWQEMTTAPPKAWIAALYLGAVPSAAGFVLWGYAISRSSVAAATSLLYLVPPVAVAIAWAWFGYLPTPIELVGGLVVTVGVLIVGRGRRIAPQNESSRTHDHLTPGRLAV